MNCMYFLTAGGGVLTSVNENGHDDCSVSTSVTKSSYWHSMTNMPSNPFHAQSDLCESQHSVTRWRKYESKKSF